MDKCIGIMGKIFGHKFKARYDSTSIMNPANRRSEYMTLAMGDKGLELLKDETHTYKGDVCTRCGKIINKESV